MEEAISYEARADRDTRAQIVTGDGLCVHELASTLTVMVMNSDMSTVRLLRKLRYELNLRLLNQLSPLVF